jgi:hypothetical protein
MAKNTKQAVVKKHAAIKESSVMPKITTELIESEVGLNGSKSKP